MKNDSIKTIAKVLSKAESILIFPHVNLDGDALGSCAALCGALRKQRQECVDIAGRRDSGKSALFGQKFLHLGYGCDKRSRISVSVWTAEIREDFRDGPENFFLPGLPYA